MTFVLVITLIFLDPPSKLELPSEQRYDPVTCAGLGVLLADWLTQDGVRVEWKCVKVDKQESPSKP